MSEGLLDTVRDWPMTQKLGALVALVLLVFAIDYLYVYSPKSEELATMQADLEQQQSTLEQKRLKVNARAEEEKRIRDLQADVKRAEARLPEGREIADLLSNIAASARAVGLDLTLFRQLPEAYSEFYADVPVTMEMRGTYHELAAFMDRVKRLDRIVNVADIQLRRPRVEGEIVVLDASCTATTFRFLDERERKLRAAQEKAKAGGTPPVPAGNGA
jgi:type IV pilus assembly protein PilO